MADKIQRVLVFKDGEDVSDACKTGEGKGNPWGWSSMNLYHHSRLIGEIYCGYPKLHPEAEGVGYTLTVTEEETESA